ncbi:DUF1345 domain-containing protein [Paralysiella testudinis]|uniref:DUF1345 domain-containing protein n=1 Tax=Paralysiella testudinis TaxID=2809020 RepID=A0A892ZGI7_9NEIS|nr:DUF1345 domain-containing protein [Paralysiella testudinis]QRQ81660.1 DUF1345 domain-containing protein [Paralysiella testudinis]
MSQNPFFSIWRYRRRLLLGLLAGMSAWLVLQVLSLPLAAVTRAIIAFDIGVAMYLGLVFALMHAADKQTLLARAHLEDEGGRTILLLTAGAAAMSLLAIALELGISQQAHGMARAAHVLLTVVTIFLSWLFTHVMFALHYARMYYRDVINGQAPCLLFPESKPQPDYWDFVYFACIIGTSGQTADVSLASSAVRRVGLLHCVLAFFYNVAVLSLLVNIASGLIGG